MKELSEADLKKIAYDCSKATFLIEKEQIGKITLREKIELKLHLAGCSICRIFMVQSRLINQMARKVFSSYGKDLKLDENFKKQLQRQIDHHADKN